MPGPRRVERRFQPSEGCALSFGRGAAKWYGRKDSNLQVSRFVAEYPVQLNDARVKFLAAGSGFEPLSSGSEPEILAAERPRCGWDWTNRTPEAGFKDQRLATNRTPTNTWLDRRESNPRGKSHSLSICH